MDSEATISELLAKIQFPSGVERMVLVNGHQANFSTRLVDGDEVFIFVPVAGG